jgi:hypothetical protein
VTAALAVDDRDMLVLKQLRDAFPEFDIGSVDGALYARKLTGGPLLAAPTLGGLASALLDRLDRPANGGPSAADEARMQAPRGAITLESLVDRFRLFYDIGPADGGGYIAVHLGVHPLRPVGTLEELDSLIRAHYWRWRSR